MSRIGQTSRRWNRSISVPREDSLASPPVTSSAWVKPWPRRCRVSASQPPGAKPQPKSSGHLPVEAALGEELAGRRGVGRAELLDVEGRGGGVGRDQPGPLTDLRAVGAGGRPAAVVLVVQLDVGPPGQQLDRLGEGQVVDLLDEGDDVAAHSATKTMIEISRRRHLERRRLLVVERAEPLQAAAAGALELQVLADDLVDLATARGRVRCRRPGCARGRPSARRPRRGRGGRRPPRRGVAAPARAPAPPRAGRPARSQRQRRRSRGQRRPRRPAAGRAAARRPAAPPATKRWVPRQHDGGLASRQPSRRGRPSRCPSRTTSAGRASGRCPSGSAAQRAGELALCASRRPTRARRRRRWPPPSSSTRAARRRPTPSRQHRQRRPSAPQRCRPCPSSSTVPPQPIPGAPATLLAGRAVEQVGRRLPQDVAELRGAGLHRRALPGRRADRVHAGVRRHPLGPHRVPRVGHQDGAVPAVLRRTTAATSRMLSSVSTPLGHGQQRRPRARRRPPGSRARPRPR